MLPLKKVPYGLTRDGPGLQKLFLGGGLIQKWGFIRGVTVIKLSIEQEEVIELLTQEEVLELSTHDKVSSNDLPIPQ